MNHKLNVHVRHDMGIYCLILRDLDGVEIVLDAQSLENLGNLLVYNFHVCL